MRFATKMNINILPNGNLQMQAGPFVQEDIQYMLDHAEGLSLLELEASFIRDYLDDFVQESPRQVGALTDAPIIRNVYSLDVFGYMDYQIYNFLEKLASGEKIVWQKG